MSFCIATVLWASVHASVAAKCLMCLFLNLCLSDIQHSA